MVLSLVFADAQEDQIEQLEDLRDVECKGHDSYAGRVQKMYHITSELR
jgi:hypothetical protein